ncbi:histidinol-phosphate transaminase [Georgenia sp. Z1491]|uniref:histidinol-phosphate transaminase n=1 Tax=Georgenia sp. Z1491 TaxID=3416707 RepID=UPI003CEF66B3
MSTSPSTNPGPPRLPLRPDLAGLSPYGAPRIDVPVILNVNENPFSPAPEVAQDIARAVGAAATGLNRYPDRDFPELREQLAAYLAVESGVELDPDQVWAGNGSNEVLLHVLQAFGGTGRTLLTATPSYSMYPEYARDTQTSFVTVDRAADFTVDLGATSAALAEHRPAVLVLASPNNPTGTALGARDLAALLDHARTTGPDVGAPTSGDGSTTATVVVIDEAYGEFRREGTPSALELLADHPHLAVARTMSKAFGMAGLRLGYLAAARELIDHLRVVRLPYHLSALTQAAALAALAHRDSLMGQVKLLRDERDALVDHLRGRGLEVVESDANFVMFGRFEDRHAVWDALVARGVLIREVGPQGMLRVSVGTPEENDRFRAALEEVLS